MINLALLLAQNAALAGGSSSLICPIPERFETFAQTALVLAVRPDASGKPRMVADESAASTAHFGTCRLIEFRDELAHWVVHLMPNEVIEVQQQMTVMLMRSLVGPLHRSASYKLPPIFAPHGRPVVAASTEALKTLGRVQMLQRIWFFEQNKRKALASASSGGFARSGAEQERPVRPDMDDARDGDDDGAGNDTPTRARQALKERG